MINAFLIKCSMAILPIFISLILLYGCAKKKPVYDLFVEGAKEGMGIVVEILPTMIGLMVAIAVFRASGLIELVGYYLEPLLEKIHMSIELFVLMLMKMFSSSASVGLLLDIFKNSGSDSYEGVAASLMLSSTETIFYTISIYYMSVGVTKIRHTLTGALIATFAGTIASIVLARWLVVPI